VTLPADAEKVAVVPPEAMVTLAGTVTAPLFLEWATTAFPEAALFSVTVQFDVPPLTIVGGPQIKDVTWISMFRLTVVWADPL
jgi:hypothetical protein